MKTVKLNKSTNKRPGKSPGKPYANLWARPGYLIRRLHQIHIGLFLKESKEFEITPVQFSLLTVLYSGDALDQITISMEVGIDRRSGADVIKRLVKRKLLVSIPSEDDKRAKLVQITEQGKKSIESMHPSMQRAQEQMLSPLNKNERDEFVRMLQRIIEENNFASRAPVSKRQFDDN